MVVLDVVDDDDVVVDDMVVVDEVVLEVVCAGLHAYAYVRSNAYVFQ